MILAPMMKMDIMAFSKEASPSSILGRRTISGS